MQSHDMAARNKDEDSRLLRGCRSWLVALMLFLKWMQNISSCGVKILTALLRFKLTIKGKERTKKCFIKCNYLLVSRQEKNLILRT